MRKSDRTRARIERAALGLFAARGVDQTTTRDLALAAGIAEGTIYRHYASKEELIGRMFTANYARLADELDDLQRGHAGLWAKLAAMVDRFCTLFESDPDLFRFLFFVQHGQIEKLPPEAPSPVKVIRAALSEAMDRGEIPRRDPDLASAWILGAVTQPAIFRIYGRVTRPLTALSQDIAAACWRLIGA